MTWLIIHEVTIVLWSRIILTTFEPPYYHNTIVTLEGYYSIVCCNTFMAKFGPININDGTKEINQKLKYIIDCNAATEWYHIHLSSSLPLTTPYVASRAFLFRLWQVSQHDQACCSAGRTFVTVHLSQRPQCWVAAVRITVPAGTTQSDRLITHDTPFSHRPPINNTNIPTTPVTLLSYRAKLSVYLLLSVRGLYNSRHSFMLVDAYQDH